MREGWKSMRLTNFVWFQRGFDLPRNNFVEGNVPVYGSTSILGYHNVSKVKAPGILTGRSGTLGKFQFANEDFWPHNTSLWVKDFKDNDEKFAYYLLQTLDFTLFNSGGAVPTLNRNLLTAYIVNIPPIETQRKIASILSGYDDLIENNLNRIKILEEMAQQTYEEWFVRMRFPGYETAVMNEETGLPEGWEKKCFGDITESMQYGYTESASTEIIGPKFLRITDIVGSNINWETVPYCLINEKQKPKYLLNSGDIVIARTGATVGYGKRINQNCPEAVFASYLIRLKLKPEIDDVLVGIFVESNSFVQIVQNMAGGAAQPNANAPILRKIEMIVPSKEVQDKFRSIVLKLKDSQQLLLNQNQRLREARDLLLPRLMMGIVEV
ncbi:MULTISPECIES: restriction endonuclease subunit S [unclassified Kaistella]|uniref:restriction endonuclease subunit S n=1 Tax=unclassified Kaistella TaxID=2762626 RepID=UPI0027350B4A|nr:MULTISPECIES: restriction endonuclease subunit S [unclassified Kaistella]MDP2454138.1 restriction endonuclease subunit S [Kaistella sp. SH11-4b]MDP2457791.1 restriction endonuclease subunit S [Kaistella sp. SH40-3]MDP2460549.1 restriction endonuclease subunit S [Kaistella sp. SH19-2b]